MKVSLNLSWECIEELVTTYWKSLAYIFCSLGANNAQKRPPPGTISAPFIMAVRGRVLYDFVCVSGANLNEGTLEILSKPLASCLLNHWMTTNCLPSESCKNTMHFPKYMLLLVVPWMFSSSSHTLRQSCATIPWYRGMARKKTVCTSCICLRFILSWVATSTGVVHCSIFVAMALVILLKIALFASCVIHAGKPSHLSIFRYTAFCLE